MNYLDSIERLKRMQQEKPRFRILFTKVFGDIWLCAVNYSAYTMLTKHGNRDGFYYINQRS